MGGWGFYLTSETRKQRSLTGVTFPTISGLTGELFCVVLALSETDLKGCIVLRIHPTLLCPNTGLFCPLFDRLVFSLHVPGWPDNMSDYGLKTGMFCTQ